MIITLNNRFNTLVDKGRPLDSKCYICSICTITLLNEDVKTFF